MECRYASRDGLARIELSGRLDQQGMIALKQALLRVESEEIQRVDLDFRGVTYIGSTGIAALLQLHKRLTSRGGSLGLNNLSEDISSLFATLKLGGILGPRPGA